MPAPALKAAISAERPNEECAASATIETDQNEKNHRFHSTAMKAKLMSIRSRERSTGPSSPPLRAKTPMTSATASATSSAAMAMSDSPAASPMKYDDGYNAETGRFVYHYRAARRPTAAARRAADADNRALRAAHQLAVPVIYFHGIAPGQYSVVAPVFVTEDDRARQIVRLEAALPTADATSAGLVSGPDLRAYATREALVRLHQHRFRVTVLHAYRERCAVCELREAALLQAAHIIDDRSRRRRNDLQRDRALRDPPPRLRPQPHGHRPRRRRTHLPQAPAGDRRSDAAKRSPGLRRRNDPAATTRSRPSGPRAPGNSLRTVPGRWLSTPRGAATATASALTRAADR